MTKWKTPKHKKINFNAEKVNIKSGHSQEQFQEQPRNCVRPIEKVNPHNF